MFKVIYIMIAVLCISGCLSQMSWWFSANTCMIHNWTIGMCVRVRETKPHLFIWWTKDDYIKSFIKHNFQDKLWKTYSGDLTKWMEKNPKKIIICLFYALKVCRVCFCAAHIMSKNCTHTLNKLHKRIFQ